MAASSVTIQVQDVAKWRQRYAYLIWCCSADPFSCFLVQFTEPNTTVALQTYVGWLVIRFLTHDTCSSSFYREAVENVAAYNLQLMRERKSRLPYVDAQTGIAQSDCHLLRSRMERRRGNLPGQVYSYPPRRWRRERKSAEPRKTTGV